ncbi:unnamed protein product, partial [Rotaria magnacalcarata]
MSTSSTSDAISSERTPGSIRKLDYKFK